MTVNSDWIAPTEFPDLSNREKIAIDLETYDPNLKTKGLGAIRKDGFVCGIAIATKNQTLYSFLNFSTLGLTTILQYPFNGFFSK